MRDRALKLSEMWANVRKTLFPFLEEGFEGAFGESHREVVWAMEVVRLEDHLPSEAGWRRIGAPRKDRKRIAAGFLAKATMNLPTTKALRERLRIDAPLRRICGWERRKDVPSEATFRRAFAEFAETDLLDKIQEALAKRHLEGAVVWNVSRDSTAIEARERPVPKTKETDEEHPARRKRGRPRKGEVVAPPEPTRLERQRTQSLEKALADLPRRCDVGAKRNAKGHRETWIGYKLQADVSEDGLPLSAPTTSASLHDSQAAIPLHRLTRTRAERPSSTN